ncbi:thermostable hemolysin [Streptomyces pratensis]|uniref:thermostable hemolysin n=1 Tax=Streptomyces pratensis TaxID=1169025 RepID=UPI003015B313
MLKISSAPRTTDAWRDAGALARSVYAAAYAADIRPDPDAFIIATATAPDGTASIVGCAGCTHASARPFFSERYLDQPIEEVIAETTGRPVARERIIEIGALAGQGGSGREMTRLIPIIAWCMGMEYILCTVTEPLRLSLEELGITFTVLGPADPDRLPAEERRSWGTYYDRKPQVGCIELRVLAPLFAGATGRYTFLEPVIELLADTTAPQEVAGSAGR